MVSHIVWSCAVTALIGLCVVMGIEIAELRRDVNALPAPRQVTLVCDNFIVTRNFLTEVTTITIQED